jgi:hypothetical protein
MTTYKRNTISENENATLCTELNANMAVLLACTLILNFF